MTRPPFADFSALAIRELTAWIGDNALWSGRLRDVLTEHFVPAAEELGLDPDEAWAGLGESVGPIYGAALEDLCTRSFAGSSSNLVADFVKKRGFRLPLLAKAYLEAIQSSAPGVYEVVAVRAGQGVTIRDLVGGGEPFEVTEIAGSRQLVQWNRIGARVVEHGGARVFTGAMFPLSAAGSDVLIAELRAVLDAIPGTAGMPAPAFRDELLRAMREAAARIGRQRIADILRTTHRILPKLLNRDGDPIAFVQICYAFPPKARREIIARFDADDSLRRTGSRPVSWDWVGPVQEPAPAAAASGGGIAFDSHPGGDPHYVVLAGLRISGKQLEVSVNSQRRGERARAFIASRLAEVVGEPGVSVTTPEEALKVAAEKPASPSRPIPKKVQREVSKRFLDTHYRNWLDIKIPALGGKTPREAARDFAGREKLVALLKELEQNETHRTKKVDERYDARWIWRELGIEKLRQ